MKSLIDAIIVDDEPGARRILRSMLEKHSAWISVVAEASNGTEAIDRINELKPDLVFLDIQMPDFTGFEVLEKLEHQPNIIFTTAFEKYALQAFDSFSVDYLLKPIRESRLEQSLDKIKRFGKLQMAGDFKQLKQLVETFNAPKVPTAFPIKVGDKILLFRYENISHFEADGKYVFLFTLDGQKYLTDYTLTALEQRLPVNFLRVQKSYIINKEKVQEIHKHFNGRFIIFMQNKSASRIITGLSFYEKIKESFGI